MLPVLQGMTRQCSHTVGAKTNFVGLASKISNAQELQENQTMQPKKKKKAKKIKKKEENKTETKEATSLNVY